MSHAIKQFLRSDRGKIVMGVGVLIALALGAYAINAHFREGTPDTAFYTTYICTETGKSFRHKNQMGEMIPIVSPFTGKNTGMPAEACCWTAEGQQKNEPTWVLLNEAVGKPGPTFCPDCGRLVVGHNPRPHPGAKPPPTETEYSARRRLRARAASVRDQDR